jgi:hypothetical protein
VTEPPQGYRGPGWQEWALSFACALLVGHDAFIARALREPQSAESYYRLLPWVPAMQSAGLAIDLGVMTVTLAWIFFGRNGARFRQAVRALAVLGVLTVWAEVWRAAHVESRVFTLTGLPFKPVNNAGIIGAQVFAVYLLAVAPSGRGPWWRTLLAKAGLAFCFWLFQWLLWSALAGSVRPGA